MVQNSSAVIITSSSTYESRVNAIEEFLSFKGYDVLVLEPGYDHHTKQKRYSKKNNHEYLPMIVYKKNLSLPRIYSLYDFAKKAFHIVEQEKPELLYVLVPANSLAKVCSEYKRKYGGMLIYDILDMWPESLPFRFGKTCWPFSVWRKLRDDNLKFANAVITECNLFAGLLERVLGYTPKTAYWPKEISQPEWTGIPASNSIHICYLGTVNHIIDIKTIVNLMGRLNRKKKIILHLIGKGETKAYFIKLLMEAGIEVKDEGIIYDENMKIRIIQQCHWGLNMMKSNVCVGLTMKSVEYLAFGLPILNTIRGDTWDLVEKEKVGYNCYTMMNERQLDDIIHLSEEVVGMRAHIRDVYEKRFSIPAFYDQMETIWSQLDIQRRNEK